MVLLDNYCEIFEAAIALLHKKPEYRTRPRESDEKIAFFKSMTSFCCLLMPLYNKKLKKGKGIKKWVN